jgi:hypothetical protein
MFGLSKLPEETKKKITEALKVKLEPLDGIKSKKHASVLSEYTLTIFTATIMELIIAGEIRWQKEMTLVPEPTWLK